MEKAATLTSEARMAACNEQVIREPVRVAAASTHVHIQALRDGHNELWRRACVRVSVPAKHGSVEAAIPNLGVRGV